MGSTHMTEDQLEQKTLAWLAELGYTLLPSLISGQLRLHEAQALIKKAE
jgi:hypothetical protein